MKIRTWIVALGAFVAGALVATAAGAAAADPQIRLLVNGKDVIFADAPPQMVNGRVMVPARPLAEALGATVAWDGAQRAVVVAGVDPEQFITIRELAQSYGVAADLSADGLTLHLVKNGVSILVPIGPGRSESTFVAVDGHPSVSQLEIRVVDGITTLRRADAAQLGWTEPK